MFFFYHCDFNSALPTHKITKLHSTSEIKERKEKERKISHINLFPHPRVFSVNVIFFLLKFAVFLFSITPSFSWSWFGSVCARSSPPDIHYLLKREKSALRLFFIFLIHSIQMHTRIQIFL